MDKLTSNKIEEYKLAMDKYNNNILYSKFNIVVSLAVIALQLVSLYNLWFIYIATPQISFIYILSLLVMSYVMTDFVNGLVHMYMDNNANYTSFFGPFIAAFHLHHKKQKYKNRHPIKVYFYESGAKLWLPVYLGIIIFLMNNLSFSFYTLFCMTAIGVLSSFAEVSHCWCHNSRKSNTVINYLQAYGILLSKEHHKHHHYSDNVNYAFLNGISDPVLNLIAKYCYAGYKQHTDIHVRAYTGSQTANR